MTSSATTPHGPVRIETIDAIHYRLADDGWAFEQERTADIEAHWQKRVAQNPHLFNGRVLLMRQSAVTAEGAARHLAGNCFLADYKAFLAWRDFGFPDATIANVFAMAALRSADGAFLLGEMGATTASSGRIYFPAGTPDPSDIAHGMLDLEGSVLRELKEETDLGLDNVRLDPGWTVVFHEPYIACMKTIRSALSAADLIASVDAFLAKETHPELARLKPVFTAGDLDADRMPDFMLAYLQHAWKQEA